MGPCDPELVSALVDGEIDDRRTEAALSHLTDCGDCRELFERYSAVRSMVRGESSRPAPADLATRVSAAVAAEARPAGRVRRMPLTGPRRGMALAAGLGAVAMVTALAWYQTGPSVAPGPAESPVADRRSADSEPLADEPQPADPAIQRYVQEHSRLLSGDADFQRTSLEGSRR